MAALENNIKSFF